MKTPDPNAEILANLRDAGGKPKYFSLCWDHRQHYLPGAPVLTLGAACLVDGEAFLCVITDQPDQLLESPVGAEPRQAWLSVTEALGGPVLHLHEPLPLETVHVPKPWGQEIWYTGIEARGVCTVAGTPLPWLLSMAPGLLAGVDGDPVLLKVLDPLPREVYGDLYFELHEEKTEVYVVTHVHDNAWPDGKGRIRFGFDPEKIAGYSSEAEFKKAYLDSVREYQKIRNRIDTELDQFRRQEGYLPDEVVPVDVLESWTQRIDPELNDRERECRRAMNAFSQLNPLDVGDVVQVPPFTPHALQHGVRVVEFQTPHYERYILSFAQKVLTQSHWDTEEALHKARLDANMEPVTQLVSEEKGNHREDIIADFEQFQVRRVALEPGGTWTLPASDTYLVIMTVTGNCRLGPLSLQPEQACYVPALGDSPTLVNNGPQSALALLAIPVN